MSAFYASTQAFYEREGLRRVIPNVLIIDAPDIEEARDIANCFLDETYPAPAYFDHALEVEPVEGITITQDGNASFLVLSVADEFILHAPQKG